MDHQQVERLLEAFERSADALNRIAVFVKLLAYGETSDDQSLGLEHQLERIADALEKERKE